MKGNGRWNDDDDDEGRMPTEDTNIVKHTGLPRGGRRAVRKQPANGGGEKRRRGCERLNQKNAVWGQGAEREREVMLGS